MPNWGDSGALAAYIHDAVASPDWDAANRIKDAVSRQFERVDPRTKVHRTGYFRHSYIPDLMLRWVNDPDRSERPVFLRDNSDLSWLNEDIGALAVETPILFGLERTPERIEPELLSVPRVRQPFQGSDSGAEDGPGRASAAPAAPDPPMPIERRSDTGGVLITDPFGLEPLVPTADHANLDSLVSRSLLRGGKGFLDEQASSKVVTTLRSGFDGAFDRDVDSTAEAIGVIDEFLGVNSGGRIVNLMQAIWVASGGDPVVFPGDVDAAKTVSDDALEFILSLDSEVADKEFWQRIGAQVTMDQICRLQLGTENTTNLRHFVAANAWQLDARACRVWGSEAPLVPYRWRIESQALAFHGGTFTAFFTGGSDSMKLKPEPAPPVDRHELGNRKHELVDIEKVAIQGLATEVEWIGVDHRDITNDPGLDAVIDNLGATHRVTHATAHLPSGRIIECDLVNATANCRTSSSLSLWEAVAYGLPLVWPLDENDHDAINDFLGVAGDNTPALEPPLLPPTLFDTPEPEPPGDDTGDGDV